MPKLELTEEEASLIASYRNGLLLYGGELPREGELVFRIHNKKIAENPAMVKIALRGKFPKKNINKKYNIGGILEKESGEFSQP